MSNPIIRTGPFINTGTNLPDNQPDVADISLVPVNCALSDWLNDEWKAYVFTEAIKKGNPPFEYQITRETYENGPSISTDASVRFAARSDASGQIRIYFYYQAAQDFNLQVDALTSASVSGGGNSAFVSFGVSVGDNSVFNEVGVATSTGTFDQVKPEIEFNEQITLPASVVPNLVKFNMFSRVNRSGNFGSDVIAQLDISPVA